MDIIDAVEVFRGFLESETELNAVSILDDNPDLTGIWGRITPDSFPTEKPEGGINAIFKSIDLSLQVGGPVAEWRDVLKQMSLIERKIFVSKSYYINQDGFARVEPFDQYVLQLAVSIKHVPLR